MKTTIEITDTVFARLRARAAREGTTLRELVEAALRQFLSGPRGAGGGGAFVLPDASVDGRGLDPSLREGAWAEVRERLYDGRGGVGP